MKRVYVWTFIALLAIYVGLALGLPADSEALEKYQMTESSIKLLSLSVVVPLVLIYLSALYGFIRFKAYADTINRTKEGPGFAKLADGLMILSFGLPISGVMSSILNYIAHTNPELLPTTTILRNYIALIFPLIAFLLIAKGAESLIKTLKRQESEQWTTLGLIGTILLSCMYTWLITIRPQDGANKAVYYLPNWLILTTLAVPYLYIWCIGLRASYRLYLYKKRIRGVVYQHALSYLAKGIAIIIGLSILLQILITLSARLNRLDFTPLLFIIYVLIGLYALGYGFVARGARKLKKIEEV